MTFLIGLIGSAVGLVGWFAFRSPLLLFLGTGCYVAELLVERRRFGLSDRAPDLVFFVFGCIAGLFIETVPWYICGMITVNFYSVYMSLLSLLLLFL